ncbi:EamA/RhaT family transporter [Marinococcus halophilus]|uniref:Transporter n=1 Tax=Marinococcus halophilus TaxID=1371 RepID=A0A510Y4K9_MARHA|nr:DMT family transporter [Marinococcus halophilus]OZT80222.1 EamA/RhaT family transporter [Marinococcus halophilus]GEK58278.1 transporter [Marinococcus halophilus]
MKYAGLLLLASLCWGSNFIVGEGLTAYASPVTLTILRYGIAALCLLPVLLVTEKRLLPRKKALLPLFLMGITGVALFNILQFTALASSSATNISIISTMNTLSIALFSAILLHERLRGAQIAAMLISTAGVLLVVTEGRLESFSFASGDAWMLLAVLVFGLYSICSRWATTFVSPMMSVCYSGLFGVLLLLPINGFQVPIHRVDAVFISSMLFLSIIATIVCMVLWGIGVQHLGATTSGLFLNFNPLFTALLAFVLFGEHLTWPQAAGSAIVIGGCAAFSLFTKKRGRLRSAPALQKRTA